VRFSDIWIVPIPGTTGFEDRVDRNGRSKGFPAFDAFNISSAENMVVSLMYMYLTITSRAFFPVPSCSQKRQFP